MENAEDDFIQVETTSTRSLNIPTRRLMTLAMIVSDILGILIAVLLAAIIRVLFLGPLETDAFLWVPAFVVILILSAALRELYPATGLSAVNQFRQLTTTTSMLTLVIISVTFFNKTSVEFSRLLIGLTWLFGLVTIPLNRTVTRHLMSKAKMWGEPVVIIGSKSQVESLTRYFSCSPKIGLKPEVGLTVLTRYSELTSMQRKQLLENARRISRELSIHTVMVAYDRVDELSTLREIFYEIFSHVLFVNPENYGMELNGVTLSQYGRMHTYEIHHTLEDRFAQFQKRVIDIILSSLGLIILFPFLSIVALLVAINSHGNVFYRQKRLGKNRKEFEIIKFRTMVPDADKVLKGYLRKNPERQAEWDAYQKLKDDPRITYVGRLLRRFSLDEFPQLWNVLVGDMSIVGPRPIMVSQKELYGANFRHYTRVRPGITGMWQISGRNRASFAERIDFDVEYVMNWSIWLDIYILVRTFWVVVRHDGVT